ncbi:retrovirus-related Pol polyprotein from transposon opus [Trichonephila clavata]|uniref:Retrovirus-related Pol polyprotein from transposon opus n=1 Tax=Trichonephila clavata TaxID=2740835 RepID=A0A8X6IXZ8_TRICU|nr:retrovirus-related Pol polyprotein from transposon opus [Trichonephila clavata]
MAYLGKARKEDLRLLAEELNLNVGDNMKISDLSKLITTHPDYDEEFSKNQLTIIIEDRKLREQQEIENRKLREQQEFEKENQRLDREFQLEKLRLENERLKGLTSTPEAKPKDAPFFRKTKLPVESNTGTSRGFKPKCFICENVGHLARECPKNTRKTPPRNARSNTITAKGTELESTKEVVTARVSIPVSVPINTRNGIDDLQFVDIKCGQTSIKAVIDTGAQISVLREDLIGKDCGEGEGTIQIISAFGEKEIAALKLFNLKIDDGKHGSVPIMCAVSMKLVNDMLISATAYEILLENVQLFDFENQRDFECTKGKDIQLESEEELSTLALGQETETSETNLAKSSFVKLQRMDESLGPVWSQAKNKQNAYEIDDGVLIHTESICGEDVKQVVLPTCKREEVMKVAHEIPLAGHLGESKTKQRIKYSFFWPKLKQDVRLITWQEETLKKHKPNMQVDTTLGLEKNVWQLVTRFWYLIPSSSHKLLKNWMGPASIIELPRPHTARVKMDDGSEKELHFNKLRPYIARIEQIGLIFDQDDEFGELHYAPTDTVELDVNDIYNHVMDSSSGLENSQKHQLADLLSKFSDVFSSVPGSAKVKGHSAHRLQTDAFRLGEGVRIP